MALSACCNDDHVDAWTMTVRPAVCVRLTEDSGAADTQDNRLWMAKDRAQRWSGGKEASCPAAAMGGPVSGPTLFLLPGVIRRPACGARLGPWCQPQAGTSGSIRDTYGAAVCRRTEKARQEASHAGVNLGNSLKWMMNTGFVRSMRNQPMATDVAADEVALGEERKGYMGAGGGQSLSEKAQEVEEGKITASGDEGCLKKPNRESSD
ncbi:hypothetical protein U0070_013112 [Myodes glareolus]|uniref:Uncharacterized protein n=1 Tax=Myodes glareolus TaxID=447135 RepID=A0AAW0HFD2_MYOGA